MTDEEKACKDICGKTPCKTICQKCKCYIGWLADGRKLGKDKQWKAMKKAQRELKKENEELKQRLEAQAESIASYERDNAELKAELECTKESWKVEKDIVSAGLFEQLQATDKENAELKKQLEMAEQVAGSNPNLFIENCNLKSENAELKEKLKGFESGEVAWQCDMDATIKQNMELKEQNKIILEDNDTLCEWVDELKQQIEELTCSKKYYCLESDGTTVPCFMTKLCADCQYREPEE